MNHAALTTAELRALRARLLAAPCLDDQASMLAEKIRQVLDERAQSEPGELVFRIEVPLPLAPTLNAYAFSKPWALAKLRKDLDLRIMAEFAKWPRARVVPLPRRFVRVTRASSAMPDEVTVDVVGGKVPVDRLVKAGILRGDTSADVEREAAWVKAPPRKGALLVEVRELRKAGDPT